MVLSVIGIAMAMVQSLPLVSPGMRPITSAYYYALLGTFLAVVFLKMPGNRDKRPLTLWIADWIMAILALVICFYFASIARKIMTAGWSYSAPFWPTVSASILFVLSIEAVRRCAGWILAIVCAVFGLYPMVADSMPGVLWGNQFNWASLVAGHAMGTESIIGIPFRVVADLLIGYIIFGVVLAMLGGGEFFMALALKLLGRTRGGPAKVAIVASSLFGSLSGSVVSNIITTGTFTIPSMKKAGYSPQYASAVEACASTGGTLMPPIMGAAAFLMATFLAVPYGDVIAAAIIPSLLFYAALLLQADCYAAKNNLQGAEEDEIPTGLSVLRQSWIFVLALAVLIYVLLVLRLESYAPWYATGILIVGSLIDPLYRPRVLAVTRIIEESGAALAQLIGILAGVGLVVGALSITGVGSAFARELVQYAHGNVYLLLFYGALTSFVLGMGMTVSACYVFLAIILAPALVQAGLNPMASHLYILYWGMLSYITPPVALAAITAASVGKADAMKTGFTAMRLGVILFILPVFFVLEPALIGQAPAPQVALALLTAGFSVLLLSAGLSGWLYFSGRLNMVERAVVIVAALLSLYPEPLTDIAGVVVAAGVFALHRLRGPATA
ncbi:TRAP transporter fused permease subunit [Pseudooceanicola sp. 216_PA32_1]|uniref:TRAP transporter fused permease subunit n=1 Tax=Pseudooceanicola pacificus TaxID=2676438 RepID=A0A844W3I7_9RHOB|nr:TRAP transporter fused permease subunit [Pseudooceanicola pacificus]